MSMSAAELPGYSKSESMTLINQMRALNVKARPAVVLHIVTITLIAFAVYFNTLFNGFVYDDNSQVLNNPWIRDVKHLQDIFSKSVWEFKAVPLISNYYRPLMHIIYMFNYHIFGLNPWGFHLVNVLFHGANSVLVFVIASRLPLIAVDTEKLEVRRTGPTVASNSRVVDYSLLTSHDSRFFAFIAALLFATHPIHTEAVAWVGAVTDLSFTFFCLLSLYFYMRSGTGIKKHDYLFSLILFPFALLCKEPAATLPVVLMAYDLAYGKKGERFFIYVKRYLPYMVILGIYLLVRSSIIGGLAPVKAHGELSTYQYVINVFPLFGQYLGKLLFPANLNAFYTLYPIFSIGEMKGLIGLLITAAYGIITVIAYKKNQTVFFSLVLIVIPLLPALYIPGTGEASLAERYLYMPSMGFVVLLALFFTWLQGKMPRYGSGILLFVLALAGLYSLQTIGRNPTWKDNFVLFSDTVHKSPDAELPRGMLGNVLMDMGRLDEAIEQYRTTLKLHPNSDEAHRNLGVALMKKGMKKEAIEEYQKAVALAPADFEARRNLVLAYEEAGLLDEEIEQYRILLDYTPNSAETHGRLGKALAKKGMKEEAISHLTQAVALNPGYIDAHYNLGSLYANSGKTDKALEHFEATVRLAPGDAFYRNILGITYGQKGLFDKAVEQFESAIRLAPSETAYRENLKKAMRLRRK